MMKLQMILEAVDRVTGPVRRMRGLIRTVGRDQEKLDAIQKRLVDGAGKLGKRVGQMAGGALLGLVGLGAGMFRTGMQFEKFGVVLEKLEGSATAGKKAMKWVSDFAATTPYELDQVMEAYIKLRSYGIDPMEGSLRTLGDTASGMGKDLMSAIEMMADAQTGEFERLKEFGVRASVQGNKVAFTYMKAGKEISVTANKSAAEIQKALLGVFDGQFGGMMEKQSKTADGMLSNIKDKISQFMLKIANGGSFAKGKGVLARVLGNLDDAEESGKLDDFAKKISDFLVKIVEGLEKVDWGKFIDGVTKVVSGLSSFFAFFSSGGNDPLDGLFNIAIVAVVISIATSLFGLAAALGVVSIAGAPIALVIAIIAALAIAAIAVWKNWDQISAWWSNLWEQIKSAIANAATNIVNSVSAMWASAKAAFLSGVDAIWNSLPKWMQGIFMGHVFVVKTVMGAVKSAGQKIFGAGGPPATGPAVPPSGRPPAPLAANNNSRIQLDIRTDKGTTARVASIDGSKRVGVTSRRGRALPGAGKGKAA